MTSDSLTSTEARTKEATSNFMAMNGARALDGGYHVIPIMPMSKTPGRWALDRWLAIDGWSRYCETPPTEIEVDAWSTWPGCGVGFATGKVVGIDIDIEEPAAVAKLRALADKMLGATPLARIGRWPRVMLLYRTEAPFPTTGLNLGKAVATYANGRQFVAWGIHPVTRDPYHWEGETPAETPIDQLPPVTVERIKAFIAQAATVLTPEQVGRSADERLPSADRRGNSVSEPAPIPTIKSALASIPLGAQDSYEYWINIGMACHAGSRGSSEGLAAWDEWSSREHRYEPGACAKKWLSFSSGGGVSVGTLFDLAFRAGWVVPEGMYLSEREAQLERKIQSGAFDFSALLKRAEEVVKGTVKTPTGMSGVETPPLISATPYIWRNPETIPLRPWIYGRSLLRGQLSVLVAPGAAGKSSMLASMALALVIGKPLLGKAIWGGPKRVWLWNLEDGNDELTRHIQAAAKHHALIAADLGDRLFVDSGLDGATLNLTTVEQRGNITIAVPVQEALTAELIAKKIDVLIVDPFVSSHSAPENDNIAIDRVAKAWARVAKDADCAILLAHHTRKLNGQEANSDATRGASALVNAARSVVALNGMTRDEAHYFGVPPEMAKYYFRAEDGKNNRAPVSGASDWYERRSVSLSNGGFEGGDDLPVAIPWTPPDAFENIDADDLKAVQRKLAGGEWRENMRATQWAGNAVADTLGLDVTDQGARNQIRKLLNIWIKNGALRVVKRKDEKTRKEFEFIEVGNAAQ